MARNLILSQSRCPIRTLDAHNDQDASTLLLTEGPRVRCDGRCRFRYSDLAVIMGSYLSGAISGLAASYITNLEKTMAVVTFACHPTSLEMHASDIHFSAPIGPYIRSKSSRYKKQPFIV